MQKKHRFLENESPGNFKLFSDKANLKSNA